MRTTVLGLALVALAWTHAAPAGAQGRHDERPHGLPAPDRTTDARPAPGGIPLKDGGTLHIGRNGVTYHFDANGRRVRMLDGQTMEAVDGTRYVMKNDALWRTLVERGTLRPAHR